MLVRSRYLLSVYGHKLTKNTLPLEPQFQKPCISVWEEYSRLELFDGPLGRDHGEDVDGAGEDHSSQEWTLSGGSC